MRHTIAIVLLAPMTLAAIGCKETVTKPDPETEKALATCRQALDDKDKLIKSSEDLYARQQRDKASKTELVITSENNLLTLKPPAPGQPPPPVDPKAATAAYQQFMDVVGKSRGAIQRCYEAALKKDTSLGGHTTKVVLHASFTDKGAFQTMSTEPSLGPAFDGCLKSVGSTWSVSPSAVVKNFQGPVVLNPT